MASQDNEPENHADLRSRAFSTLTGRTNAQEARASAVKALRVLYDLASSPATAADALALLHELQVHQVELEMLGENLRNSLAESEAELRRWTALYDFAPVALFTVDPATAIIELNLAAAELFGAERDALFRRTLDSFLAPTSGRALQAMLARVAEGSHREAGTLQLALREGAQRAVRAVVNADPAGGRFLVALAEIGEQERD